MIEKFNKRFETRLQERIAYLAIGRSALRNQGAVGMVQRSRDFCKQLPLEVMAEYWNQGNYRTYLDDQTRTLMSSFRKGAKNNFGAARKALNLFFRDVVYNQPLSKYHKLKLSSKHIAQLEVPLDSYTTKGIIRSFPDLKKRWKGIKHLCINVSDEFQEAAEEIAIENNTFRVHLDVFYWRENL